MKRSPVVIAVCGKGGVGKTCVSALLVRCLCRDGANRVLAIDADPAVGLSHALGVAVHRTVDEIRRDLISRLGAGETGDRAEVARALDFELFGALTERENLAFLAIGRPEGEGCFCQVNALLREIIGEVAGNFDYVVIDAEAGVEQVSRRVMARVTHLLLVTDASLRGRRVAETIHGVAAGKHGLQRAALLLNRMRSLEEAEAVRSDAGLPVGGILLEDEVIRAFDRKGRSFFDLPDGDAQAAMEEAVTGWLG